MRTRDDSGKLFHPWIAGPTLAKRDKVGTGGAVQLGDAEKVGRSGLAPSPAGGRDERVELTPVWLPLAKKDA
jgi:hypothetical protein